MAIELVLCDSGKLWDRSRSAEFDVRCYQQIFAPKYPDTTFMPTDADSPIITGAFAKAARRGLLLDQPVPALSDVVKVSNGNGLSAHEIRRRERLGFIMLSRRNLTAYLFDGEVLEALCAAHGLSRKMNRVTQICSDAMGISVSLGHEPDNWELPAPTICSQISYELNLTSPRFDWREFVVDILAPMLAPGTAIYDALDQELFSPNPPSQFAGLGVPSVVPVR